MIHDLNAPSLQCGPVLMIQQFEGDSREWGSQMNRNLGRRILTFFGQGLTEEGRSTCFYLAADATWGEIEQVQKSLALAAGREPKLLG